MHKGLKTVKRTVSFEIEFVAENEDNDEDIKSAIWECFEHILRDAQVRVEDSREAYPDCRWTACGFKSFDQDSIEVSK